MDYKGIMHGLQAIRFEKHKICSLYKEPYMTNFAIDRAMWEPVAFFKDGIRNYLRRNRTQSVIRNTFSKT
jgi:hypothetical protein